MGVPDGMVTDMRGRLWVACYGGHGIAVFDPQRPDLVAEYIRMPAVGTMSLVWAGPHYSELYVTSALSETGKTAPAVDPLADSLFHATVLDNGRTMHMDSYRFHVLT